jgi:choline dehydrogenase-like flavoprotein
VRFDVVVVGGGTAGCVLASRLSENDDRRVCLLEAGPDFGPLREGRWPPEILSARTVASTYVWEAGAADGRTLGGKVLGGSSSVNACMVVQGTSADYDEWGPDWSYETFRPYLERARAMLRTAPTNTDEPGPFHVAFVDAAQALGFPLLDDMDDLNRPVGVGSFPANVVEGTRWSAALAYLDGCRTRPNLIVRPDTLADRVVLRDGRAVGVVDADGHVHEAETVVLAAGAYFSPAILLRSGIGPQAELNRLAIPVVADLPVGERLLDHCGVNAAWAPSGALRDDTDRRARSGELFAPHALLKAASGSCPPDAWDLHLVTWIAASEEPGDYEANIMVFLMKPSSHGRVTLRSPDPSELPHLERGFLSHHADLPLLLEGLGLARELAATSPLAALLADERRPGTVAPEQYVRSAIRGYFHPAGTCAIGEVVDTDCRVFAVEGLLVVDASVIPTIPRANTNLTTAAIAERIAATMA